MLRIGWDKDIVAAAITDTQWTKQAIALSTRVESAHDKESFSCLKELSFSLNSWQRPALFSDGFSKLVSVDEGQLSSGEIALAIIRVIRRECSYMISRNPDGIAIASLVHPEFGEEVSFTAKSETLALIGVIATQHIIIVLQD